MDCRPSGTSAELRGRDEIVSPRLMTRVRDVRRDDLPQVAAIFADVVASSHYSLVVEAPSVDYWTRKLTELAERDAFLVAVAADSQEVMGYAYSAPFRDRPAYDATRETTIYLAVDARGKGVGLSLYAALLDRLAELGNRLAIGVVAEPNPASEALHRRLDFDYCGVLPAVGEKFGQLWSTSFWVRRLV